MCFNALAPPLCSSGQSLMKKSLAAPVQVPTEEEEEEEEASTPVQEMSGKYELPIDV